MFMVHGGMPNGTLGSERVNIDINPLDFLNVN
jgi:hypothetical protein